MRKRLFIPISKNKVISGLGLGMLLLVLGWCGVPDSHSQIKQRQTIEQALEKFKKDPSMQHATWGFYAYNLNTGQVVAEHNIEASLIPASAQKLITTGFALSRLGADYQYETKLAYRGNITSGVLEGDLVVIGSGDPTLGTDRVNGGLSIDAFLKKWANAVKNKGIRTVQGNLVVDVSVMSKDNIPPNWLWSDIGNYYGSGYYGINIRENHYGLIFKSGYKEGDSTVLRYTFPKMPDLVIENAVKTGKVGSTDDAYIYGSPESSFRRVIGTIPPGQEYFEVRGALPNPPYQMGRFLKETLEGFGIKVQGKIMVTHQMQKYSEVLDVHKSPQLLSIAYTTLHLSHNLMAEALLHTAGKPKNQPMNLYAALDSLKAFVQQAKVPIEGSFFSDGSGLSRTNLITCKQFVELLKYFHQSPIGKDLEKCLPVIGESPGFVILSQNIQNKGKIKVKSGYMSRIRSFAGYVYNAKNEKIAFAFIVNYYTCPNIESLYKMAPVLDALAN